MWGRGMDIEWRERRVEEWRAYLQKVPRTNYLQSVPFARAVLDQDKKQTRIGLLHRGGSEVGIMAVNELRVGPLSFVDLFRGPLWFAEDPGEDLLREFARAFDREFPRSLLRFRRWLPEWPDGDVARRVLAECGFRPRRQDYETLIVDLSPSEEQILQAMRGNWRNQLRQAERAGVGTSVDTKGSTAKLFLHRYDQDRKERKYYGRPKAFMRSEMSLALAYDEMFILWAAHNGRSVAAILVVQHGRTASYRIGWTTPEGRACNAHNLLLWTAVKELKGRGIRYFDLVGVEPGSEAGLTHFKRGLGGAAFKTMGMYS